MFSRLIMQNRSRERSGSVVERLTRDRRAAGSSLDYLEACGVVIIFKFCLPPLVKCYFSIYGDKSVPKLSRKTSLVAIKYARIKFIENIKGYCLTHVPFK